ncbi:unnamed protein product [Timema podura]|uniref:Uncharacterized protein n=1 Tax=Timema podura TaxID=61482 RepID=A0ABN7NRS2_TIMPD|nr:unnamed protein product [Timema podura]
MTGQYGIEEQGYAKKEKVCENALLGRHLVATRDIKEGVVVYEGAPPGGRSTANNTSSLPRVLSNPGPVRKQRVRHVWLALVQRQVREVSGAQTRVSHHQYKERSQVVREVTIGLKDPGTFLSVLVAERSRKADYRSKNHGSILFVSLAK